MPIILLHATSLEANGLNQILEAERKAIEAGHQLNISQISQAEKTLSVLQEKGSTDEIAAQKAIVEQSELNLKRLDQQEKRLSEMEASGPSDLRVIFIPQDASQEERRQFTEDVHLRLKSISDPEQTTLLEFVLLELERAKSLPQATHIVIQKSEIKHLKGLSSVLKIESGFGGLLGKILGRIKNDSRGANSTQNSVLSKKSGSERLTLHKVGQKIYVTEYPNTFYDAINLNLSGLSQQYRGLELNFEKKWGGGCIKAV